MKKGRNNLKAGQKIGSCVFLGYEGLVKNIGYLGKFICPVCSNFFIDQISKIAVGRKKSCGCNSGMGMLSHGASVGGKIKTEYSAYRNMKKRCLDVNCKSYPDYGGRGIKICDRWLDSELGFINFLADMGNKPTVNHSIERDDVNGDYTPINCKWATTQEQSENKRNNVFIEYKGEVKTLQKWSESTGIHKSKISYRIKHGWTPERALS